MWCFLCFQIVSMKSQRTSCAVSRIYHHISCYRLAVFNIDTVRRIHSLVYRLPNALFILSLPLVLFGFFNCSRNSDKPMGFVNNHTFSAYILNAEIPLFSLKIKSLILRITHYKLAFCCFLFCCCFFQYAGIPLVIICYVLLSIVVINFYWWEKKR
jgi:CDP-diacylglycerol--serine O-phosphatidyltransferase